MIVSLDYTEISNVSTESSDDDSTMSSISAIKTIFNTVIGNARESIFREILNCKKNGPSKGFFKIIHPVKTCAFKIERYIRSHYDIEDEEGLYFSWIIVFALLCFPKGIHFMGISLEEILEFLQANSNELDSNIIWRIEGNQDDAFGGSCNSEKVLENFKKLKPSPFVHFREDLLITNQLNGGACSAMSLHLARAVANARCIEKQSISSLQEILEQYTTCREEFRNIQAAFNTIAVNPDTIIHLSERDRIAEKMSTLASFFDLKLEKERTVLTNMADEIPDGMYLGRAIVPSTNHKTEAFGHSIMFFKIGADGILYDPNNGGMGLGNDKLSENLKNTCNRIMHRWALSDFYFYPLTPFQNNPAVTTLC